MPACADLIKLLQRPSSSPSEQKEAAAALAALPMTPQVWSIAVGALPRLVELMQHLGCMEGIREQAKRALHHVADYALLIPRDQVHAASAGDLSSLVQLLHGDVGFEQSAVIFTLGTLALHAYNRSPIVEARAIGRIVKLLKSSTQEVQLSAARALNILSMESQTQALLLSVGGAIASLVRLLKSSSAIVQGAALSTLGNIANNADGQAAVAAAGAIPSIVRLLNSKATIVQQEAARALSCISGDAAHQASVTAAGAIAPLVLLLKSSSEAAQMSAAMALCNISFTPVVQARVTSAGAVAPLAHLLKSRSAEVREQAVKALCNISNHPDSIPQIFAAAGAISSLVSFVKAVSSAEVRARRSIADLGESCRGGCLPCAADRGWYHPSLGQFSVV